MSRKRITKQGKNTHIVTENGATTTSGAMYVQTLKDYDTYLPNGFNAELAQDVLAIIERNPLLWDQGSWRSIMDKEDLERRAKWLVDTERTTLKTATAVLKAAKEQQAWEDELARPKCGTAMCFAGWVGELTGVDWVIDAYVVQSKYAVNKAANALLKKMIEENEDSELFEEWEDKVLVRHDDPVMARMYRGTEKEWPEPEYYPHLSDYLRARGFTVATHSIYSVSEYAQARLGLGSGLDLVSGGIPLFAGNNSLETIKDILEDLRTAPPRRLGRQDQESSVV